MSQFQCSGGNVLTNADDDDDNDATANIIPRVGESVSIELFAWFHIIFQWYTSEYAHFT